MAEAAEQSPVALYFNKAYADHTDMTLLFVMDMCQFSTVRGPCVMIKNRHFVVRIPLERLKDQQIIWGGEVHGYFSVRDVDARTVHFRSRLARIYNAPPDSLFLVMPLPAHIDHDQRRNSRRVDIDRDSVGGFGVWYGSMEGGDDTSLPQQVWRPFENAQCQLGELSASGMRLDFNSDNPLVSQLAMDTPVLLKGDFGSKGRPMPIFIQGTVVRKMPRRDREGLMSVGCHFNSWRKTTGPEGERWFKADPREGIAIVSQWLGRNFRGNSSLAHMETKKEL